METIDEAKEAIKTVERLQNELKKFIFSQAGELAKKQKSDYSRLNNFRFAIVRKMIFYMEKYDEATALEMVFNEFKEVIQRREYLQALWSTVKHQRAGLELYARRYMAKKMKAAGFKQCDIALTMGLSHTSIYKLLAVDN